MIGKDCLPDLENGSCVCGIPWAEMQLSNCGSFILRTYSGAILRTKKKVMCATCGVEKKWDPSLEYIHSIDDDSEGGDMTFNFCCSEFSCLNFVSNFYSWL